MDVEFLFHMVKWFIFNQALWIFNAVIMCIWWMCSVALFDAPIFGFDRCWVMNSPVAPLARIIRVGALQPINQLLEFFLTLIAEISEFFLFFESDLSGLIWVVPGQPQFSSESINVEGHCYSLIFQSHSNAQLCGLDAMTKEAICSRTVSGIPLFLIDIIYVVFE